MLRKLILVLGITVASAVAACSPSRMAANLAGKAMASGGDVYASEEDPELLMAALPFGLKTMEGLITSSPGNTNLRLAAARGFAAYAYLVQQIEGDDRSATTAERRALDRRVARLFRRGRDHAMAGLEARNPGITESIKAGREEALASTSPADTELLYWAAAAWAGDESDMVRKMRIGQLQAATLTSGGLPDIDPDFRASEGHAANPGRKRHSTDI